LSPPENIYFKMKVSIVIYSLNIGGAENSILNMARIFMKNGHDVWIIESENKGPWNKYFKESGVKVKTFALRLLSIPYFHSLKIAKELRQFDVIFLIDSPFAQAALGKLKINAKSFPQLRANLQSMYFNASANNTQWNYITAVSPLLKEDFILNYPELTGRIKVIPNGIPIPPKRSINYSNLRRYNIIYIGRLDNTFKGVLLIPEIVKQLILNGHDLSITITGEGPAKQDMVRLINAYNLQSYFIFLGFVPKDTISELLCKHDFLIMPSSSEGFPNVMLEAMANQVIPVVSLINGVTDVCVTDSINGFFGQPGDVSSYVNAFERAFSMRDKLNEVSLNAYKTVKEQYSIDIMEHSYLELMSKCDGCIITRSNKIDIRFLKRHYPFVYLPYFVGRIVTKFLSRIRALTDTEFI